MTAKRFSWKLAEKNMGWEQNNRKNGIWEIEKCLMGNGPCNRKNMDGLGKSR